MSTTNNNNANNNDKEQLALDDDRRVKVISPSMLVLKRFLRNKLAILGLVIIVVMFIFSFIGPFFSPYGESDVFTSYELTSREYANASTKSELRYTYADGQSLTTIQRASMDAAIANGETEFEAGGSHFSIVSTGEKSYLCQIDKAVAEFSVMGGIVALTPSDDSLIVTDELKAMLADAVANNDDFVEIGGEEFNIAKNGKFYQLTNPNIVGIASPYIYSGVSSDTTFSLEFKMNFENAVANGAASFSADGAEYTIASDLDNDIHMVLDSTGEEFANVSTIAISAVASDIFLTVEYKQALQEAITNNASEFTFEDILYEVSGVNGSYQVKTESSVQLIQIYKYPSAEHWLGTDANGMDILTRLMYGGRISLMIGFVVVIIETVLGVILGGIAGYFGGWIDNLIMRLVDIFNCIPSLPLYIIIGAIMDAMKLAPQVRIYMLMLIMGVLSWPGIARLVRGQILSLREQEFMIATEATGISVSRRIFRHLVPNVIPQLIVMATMGLGSIIITESTLSFLGLGVKYPFASWGNIINAVSNIHVMTNYWFVWIPAGFLILITVLGFNFIGDGLRDAFDPKMKR